MIGSLFSGIGGLELGLEWAGLGPVAWQVEQDAYCRKVLAKHWPDALRYEDVRAVGASNLSRVDVLCGGFPCQDLSYAGKGAGLAGARSGLWFEYARIVGELRPKLVIVENVAALATRGLDRVLGDLSALGYDSLWFPLRAADLGAPHRRERLFVVGYTTINGCGPRWPWRSSADGAGEPERTLQGERVGLADSDAVRELQPQGAERNERGRTSNRGELAHTHEQGLEGRRLQERERGSERAAGQGSADRPAEGFVESSVGRSADGISTGLDGRWPAGRGEAQHEWEPPRVASNVPQRRQRLQALGNAVVPQVAYAVGLVAKAMMERADTAAVAPPMMRAVLEVA